MKKKGIGIAILMMALILAVVINMSQNLYSGEERKAGEGITGNKLVIAHTEIFGELERPQVLFDHKIHADKYTQEGCRTCHPQNNEGSFVFDLPVKERTRQKEAVMDAYHTQCIGCHTKLIRESKKAGPVQCGSCHRKTFETATMHYPHCEFDFAIHDKHVRKLNEDCSHCHHIYDIEEESEDLRLVYEQGTEESCFYCHDLEKKRGPALSRITQVAKEQGLSMRKVSHAQCVNCHLDFRKKGEKAGPVACSECHTGKYKTESELVKVPRPDRDQPAKPFLFLNDAQMKGVLFDHELHEKNAATCRSCHHETLMACRKCHGLTGSPEGGGINIAGAYHDIFSQSGCTGCHAVKKSRKDCAGCHHHLIGIDVQAKGPKKEFCAVCHSGRKEKSSSGRQISFTELSTRKVPEKVTIKILEKEFEPAIFPHREIVKKLIEISNRSEMATYFHRDIGTICTGCHHESDPQAEEKPNNPPQCRRCHSLTFDPQNLNKPRLIAAYHRQCIGCHDMMGIAKTKECRDCHKEKKGKTVQYFQEERY
jgi:hypothetical protein